MIKEVALKSVVTIQKLIELNFFHTTFGLKAVSYVYDEQGEEVVGVIVEEKFQIGEEPNLYMLTDIQYVNIKNGFYISELKWAKKFLEEGCTFSVAYNNKTGFYSLTIIELKGEIFNLICTREERDYLLNSVISSRLNN